MILRRTSYDFWKCIAKMRWYVVTHHRDGYGRGFHLNDKNVQAEIQNLL